jgi:hypothetical protein
MAKVKLKLTESQMKYLMEQGRLDFLKNQFGVVSDDEWKELSKKDLSKVKAKKKSAGVEGEDGKQKNIQVKTLMSPEGDLLALYMVEESVFVNPDTNKNETSRKIKVRISQKVFDDATNADPTVKKVYVQWILKTFVNFIKEGHMDEAIRFIDEDLPQANEYLGVFDKVKNTKLFSESGSPTDINQYTDLSQLYSAVDPFIEKEVGQLEGDILKYVKANRAKILFQDSKWLIYEPLDRDANCVMSSYASWCTAREGNTMFKNYTAESRYRQPDGSPSKIYVIINKDVLKGSSNEVYQFHFESDQFKDRTNGSNIDLYSFFEKYPKLREFFKGQLIPLAKASGGQLTKNHYLKILMAMGEVDDVFEFIDANTSDIDLSGLKLPKLPDVMSKFSGVSNFLANNVGLHEIPKSIGDMSGLEILLLSNNNIKSVPDSIGNLKNLQILNLKNNDLKKLPDSIAGLDESNGGTLYRLSIDLDKFGKPELERLKKLLPSVSIS